ncbi:hypothetical protein [Pseudoalteromonas sp. Of7M-16]|uniref:hypothetical protein n=1 Tax=Pseudoalteromonas sp. Of7M-16 TaxID=2917756 RepID=UPI001EF41A78|nr:hypothetical protein [Pseudoalteromonas sp. Of7M-16]MCG7551188.1 hypothetical protein [Pseudoalteromonas sp. Of7M-16]
MTSHELGPPKGMSDEDWKAFLEHEKSWQAMLKQRFDDDLKLSPPIPPWIKYPEHDSDSMFWRMGVGEEYLFDYFGVYLKYASKAELESYKLEYPAPNDWAGWYDKN